MPRTPEIIQKLDFDPTFLMKNAWLQWLRNPFLMFDKIRVGNKHNFVFASCSGNAPLMRMIAHELGMSLDEVMEQSENNPVIKKFDDGELRPQYSKLLRNKHVVIGQGAHPSRTLGESSINDQLMELLLAIDAARYASAREITVFLPYLPYARQDKKDQPCVSIAVRLILDLIKIAGANRVVVMDPHKDQIGGMFDGPFDIFYASEIFVPELRQKLDTSRVVFVAPDGSAEKMTTAYSKRVLGERRVGVVHKDRDSGTAQSTSYSYQGPSLDGAIAIVIDDMIAGASTMIRTAEQVEKLGVARDRKGQPEIYGVAPHALFLGNALSKIRASPFKEVWVTNSVEPDQRVFDRRVTDGKIKVFNVAKLAAEIIRRVHTGESLGIN